MIDTFFKIYEILSPVGGGGGGGGECWGEDSTPLDDRLMMILINIS